jgi:hypothetical protein
MNKRTNSEQNILLHGVNTRTKKENKKLKLHKLCLQIQQN